jgi:hypothetical protein
MSKTFLITWQWPDSIDRRVDQLCIPDDTFTEGDAVAMFQHMKPIARVMGCRAIGTEDQRA